MSQGGAGFLLGAIPGLIYLAQNMWRQQRLQKLVRDQAWKDKDWGDTQLSIGQQHKLLTRSRLYVDPDDSPEMVKAKMAFINELPAIMRRHWIGGAVMIVGAISGLVVGGLID